MLGTELNVHCLSGKHRKPSKRKDGAFSDMSGHYCADWLQISNIKVLQPYFGFILYNGRNQQRIILYICMKIFLLGPAHCREIWHEAYPFKHDNTLQPLTNINEWNLISDHNGAHLEWTVNPEPCILYYSLILMCWGHFLAPVFISWAPSQQHTGCEV